MTGTRRPPPPEPPRLVRAWPPARDVLSFAIGAFILLHETLDGKPAQPWLVATGFACLGIAGSGAAQRWLLTKFEEKE